VLSLAEGCNTQLCTNPLRTPISMQVAFQMTHFSSMVKILILLKQISNNKNRTSLVLHRNEWIQRLHSYLCCGLFLSPRIAAERQFIIPCQRWRLRPTEIRTELARERDGEGGGLQLDPGSVVLRFLNEWLSDSKWFFSSYNEKVIKMFVRARVCVWQKYRSTTQP